MWFLLAIIDSFKFPIQVDMNKLDAKQRCALFYAVESGNVSVTTYLLQRMKLPAQSDVNGLSLLMVAVVTGNQTIVTELLKSKFARDLLNKVIITLLVVQIFGCYLVH